MGKKITIFKKNAIFILLTCLSLILSNSLRAESKHCTISGQWFDKDHLGLSMYKLEEVDSKISLGEEVIHPICGEYVIEGITDGKTFSFKLFMSNTEEEYCRTWTEFTGEFISTDCAQIKGQYTLHLELSNTGYETTVPFSWFRNIIKIISPSHETELIISAEPRMPEFRAIAVLEKPDGLNYLSRMIAINYAAPPFAWNIKMRHSPIPGRLDFDVRLDEVITNDPTFIPNFNLLKTADKYLVDGGIMGGELTLSVDYYKAVRDERKYIIKGTNPGKVAIEQVLTDTIMRQIACQESRYRQFDADREGGIGFPMIALDPKNKRPVGGAGIMQLYQPQPTAAQVWNWRKNIEKGLDKLATSHHEAKSAHIKERIRLNNERMEVGLPLCPQAVPTKLTSDQILRETIRRYNCGVEYRWEPRNAPDCKGEWVVYHSCDEDDGADLEYVDKVLSCRL